MRYSYYYKLTEGVIPPLRTVPTSVAISVEFQVGSVSVSWLRTLRRPFKHERTFKVSFGEIALQVLFIDCIKNFHPCFSDSLG